MVASPTTDAGYIRMLFAENRDTISFTDNCLGFDVKRCSCDVHAIERSVPVVDFVSIVCEKIFHLFSLQFDKATRANHGRGIMRRYGVKSAK